MRALAILLRLYSYLYHLALTLFLLGVSALAIFSGGGLSFDMLPLSGWRLSYALFACSLVGLISLLLAATGKFRHLFPVWALAVVVFQIRGFFWTSYAFDDYSHFRQALWLTAGGLLAFIGSLMRTSKRR